MKKIILIVLLFPYFLFSQKENHSEPSKFIDRSSYFQINLDENQKATFKSGFGESVQFYPAEIIDLKNSSKLKGVYVDSSFEIGKDGMLTIYSRENAWVGMDEIGDLIIWFENYVIPNLKDDVGKNKTVKYIFNCKDLTLRFEIIDKTQRFIVVLNNSKYLDKFFWTESQVDKIPNVVKTLKYIQSL